MHGTFNLSQIQSNIKYSLFSNGPDSISSGNPDSGIFWFYKTSVVNTAKWGDAFKSCSFNCTPLEYFTKLKTLEGQPPRDYRGILINWSEGKNFLESFGLDNFQKESDLARNSDSKFPVGSGIFNTALSKTIESFTYELFWLEYPTFFKKKINTNEETLAHGNVVVDDNQYANGLGAIIVDHPGSNLNLSLHSCIYSDSNGAEKCNNMGTLNGVANPENFVLPISYDTGPGVDNEVAPFKGRKFRVIASNGTEFRPEFSIKFSRPPRVSSFNLTFSPISPTPCGQPGKAILKITDIMAEIDPNLEDQAIVKAGEIKELELSNHSEVSILAEDKIVSVKDSASITTKRLISGYGEIPPRGAPCE